MSSIIEETLAVHNALRAAHGAEPLEWSDECAELAQAQADVMAAQGFVSHDHDHGPSGKHGQNVCMAQHREYGHVIEDRFGEVTPTAAIKIWYNEVNHPGYDFESHGFHDGTAHFSQLVWAETTHVGLAISGQYVCANYFPAGNSMKAGAFEDNVFESKTTDFDDIVGSAAKKPKSSGGFFGGLFGCCASSKADPNEESFGPIPEHSARTAAEEEESD